jgi:hypothetical protein
MKPRVLLITSFICLALLLTPSFSWEATDISAMNLRKMRNIYGFYIARFYQTVKGLPLIDLESKDKLVIAYRREDSACNEIFLRENPDMAEDCKKVREELTFVNKHRNIVRVHIKGGKILSTKITTSFDEKRLVKNRAVILLHDALIVHDSVMDRYSRNLAKIYHFPGVKPRVEIDRNHNVLLRIGNKDLIRFDAKDFRQTESQGFKLTDKPILRQNGTRAMPDISYLGKRPHMVAVNWSYPPLSGHFTLYRGSKRIGKIPTALLYKPLKNGRAQALFEDEGLLNYLKRKYEDGSLKNRYGIAIHKFVGTLIETQDS